MLILIAPKFHPRHSRPRIAYTDSATIPVCRYYRYRRYYYIIFAAIVTVTTTLAATIHIIFTADRYCCLPLRYHRSLSLRLLLQLPRRRSLYLVAARCDTAATNAARAAVAYPRRCGRYRCSLPLLPLSRIQSLLSPPPLLFEYNRYRCFATQSQPSLITVRSPLPSPLNFKF